MVRKVFALAAVMLAGSLFAQSISITSIIPPIPIPPKISSVSDNATSAQTGDVTVTAKITTYATTKFHDDTDTGGSRWIEFLPVPSLSTSQLCYSTDYDAGDPPTWTCSNMTVDTTTDNSSDSTWPNKVYDVSGTIPGQAEGTKITYVINAEDDYSNSDNGVGHSKAFYKITPAAGPGVGSSWNDAKSILSAETAPPSGSSDESQTFANPPDVQPSSMQDDLDVLELHIANGGTSSNKLYTRMTVQGNISAGSSDLSAANGYVIAAVNMKRPPLANPPNVGTSDSDLARGVFAALWFPNASQTAGALPTNPMLVDAEATVASSDTGSTTVLPDGQASAPLVSRAPSDPSGTVTLVTDLSNLDVTADTGHKLYDDAYIFLAATAVVDGSDLNNIQFTINDVTNGARYYDKNFSYTVAICQSCPTTVDLKVNFKDASGTPVSISGTADLYEGTTKVQADVPISSAASLTFAQLDTKKSYKVVVKGTGYFSADVTPTLTGASGTVSIDAALFTASSGGDTDGDSTVSRTDLDTVIQSYGKNNGDGGYNAAADLNNDGKVNLKDIGILLKNYGKTAN